MKWYIKVMKNFTTFSGRARRKEYWMFTLVNGIIAIVLYFPGAILVEFPETEVIGFILCIPYFLYSLVVFLPSLAVSIRRLHDQDKSGWWFLINFFPCVGPIWFLVLTCLDGTPGDNQYGPASK
tara:strand:+ start:259 stop:630 length:372 start_codon:yes stop_codon:yes gene_type:complete